MGRRNTIGAMYHMSVRPASTRRRRCSATGPKVVSAQTTSGHPTLPVLMTTVAQMMLETRTQARTHFPLLIRSLAEPFFMKLSFASVARAPAGVAS